MTPFIFLATARTLGIIRLKFSRLVFAGLVLLMAFLGFLNVAHYKEDICKRIDDHRDDLTSARWVLVRSIPRGAGVIATFDFLAELSLRKNLYSFHKVYDDFYQDHRKMAQSELNTGMAFTVPGDVQYALIDSRDSWLQDCMREEPAVVRGRIRLFLEDWKAVKRAGSITLYRRKVKL